MQSLTDFLPEDRRSRRRYALKLPLNYKLFNETRITVGSGATRNLSSNGVAFEVLESMQPGKFVELEIQWPVALEGDVPLKLVVQGPVVWNEGDLAAIRITRLQFRTQPKARTSNEKARAGRPLNKSGRHGGFDHQNRGAFREHVE